mmetsp:Transcript_4972/g.22432  ORF Transcript_4972/g.22432 Transcript_4972/m.22432 type:complete len:216 (-) Transcript_4972:880-1527(-)
MRSFRRSRTWWTLSKPARCPTGATRCSTSRERWPPTRASRASPKLTARARSSSAGWTPRCDGATRRSWTRSPRRSPSTRARTTRTTRRWSSRRSPGRKWAPRRRDPRASRRCDCRCSVRRCGCTRARGGTRGWRGGYGARRGSPHTPSTTPTSPTWKWDGSDGRWTAANRWERKGLDESRRTLARRPSRRPSSRSGKRTRAGVATARRHTATTPT